MRGLLVTILVTLPLAGCAQDVPPAQEREPPLEPLDFGPWYSDGAWSLRVAPAVLEGLPGEAIPFTVEVRRSEEPHSPAYLQPKSLFTHLDDTPVRTVGLPREVTRASGHILAGAAPTLDFEIVVGNSFYHVYGPAILGRANATLTSFPTFVGHDVVPTGASARMQDGRANVTYLLHEACTFPQVPNEFQLVETAQGRMVVGFVEKHKEVPCGGRTPFGYGVVSALTPPLPPGDLRVRIFSSYWCACPPDIHDATLRVP